MELKRRKCGCEYSKKFFFKMKIKMRNFSVFILADSGEITYILKDISAYD
jgi:hypothetical protein